MKTLEDFLPRKVKAAIPGSYKPGRITIDKLAEADFLFLDGKPCFQIVNVVWHDGMLEIMGHEPQLDNTFGSSPALLKVYLYKIEAICKEGNIKYLVVLG